MVLADVGKPEIGSQTAILGWWATFSIALHRHPEGEFVASSPFFAARTICLSRDRHAFSYVHPFCNDKQKLVDISEREQAVASFAQVTKESTLRFG